MHAGMLSWFILEHCEHQTPFLYKKNFLLAQEIPETKNCWLKRENFGNKNGFLPCAYQKTGYMITFSVS